MVIAMDHLHRKQKDTHQRYAKLYLIYHGGITVHSFSWLWKCVWFFLFLPVAAYSGRNPLSPLFFFNLHTFLLSFHKPIVHAGIWINRSTVGIFFIDYDKTFLRISPLY
ncbi:hypothetical protein BDF20DRAFT_842382 [Mycotypha africana]|uniref:uncharacterized protein n=1 Tax=Mycotypha africana TaxID=64632 RepID=UPI002301E10D|nr:uncharacterized protein BDF20DRAFT_842382 [Mycotypha africana]KAI8991050.1 hypothetical protein BDF20DRAFT_842382 [Mycotypha africana]